MFIYNQRRGTFVIYIVFMILLVQLYNCESSKISQQTVDVIISSDSENKFEKKFTGTLISSKVQQNVSWELDVADNEFNYSVSEHDFLENGNYVTWCNPSSLLKKLLPENMAEVKESIPDNNGMIIYISGEIIERFNEYTLKVILADRNSSMLLKKKEPPIPKIPKRE